MTIITATRQIKTFSFLHNKIIYIIGLFFIPIVLYAQGGSTGGDTIQNWLNVGTIPLFLSALFEDIAKIGVVVLAFYIVYTGFLFVSAQGNEQALQKAKESLKWVLLGGALILGAWVLSLAVLETINTITP